MVPHLHKPGDGFVESLSEELRLELDLVFEGGDVEHGWGRGSGLEGRDEGWGGRVREDLG